MVNLNAVTASNGAALSDEEGAQFLLDEYDVRPQADITEDGELVIWGRSPFQVFTDDMSMDECTSEFLKELTGVLDEELVIQSIGAEKCRYPVMAAQYRVNPENGSVNVRNLDRDERNLDSSECSDDTHRVASIVLTGAEPAEADLILETLDTSEFLEVDRTGSHYMDVRVIE
ncbi:hypothetical protein [Halomicrococcus sp. NG-SE-24]|uniref:hypothetical protein n=1 Tax=Halomicrococcus sp. NG-SE-24 TaxID=3436928 RepID=UPI003D999366